MNVYLLGSESEYRKSKAISQSEALIYEQEPIQFYKHKILETNIIRKYSSGFAMGTAIELAFQEGIEEYEEKYAVIPEHIDFPSTDLEIAFCDIYPNNEDIDAQEAMKQAGYKRTGDKSAQNLIDKYSAYMNFNRNCYLKDLIQISFEDDTKIRKAVSSLDDHPRVSELFNNYTASQVAIVASTTTSEGNDLKLKALIDNLVIDFNNRVIYNVDLKTTIKPMSTFPRWYRTYNYGFQQGWYEMILRLLLKKDPEALYKKEDISDFDIQTICIAVETIGDSPITRIFSPTEKYKRQQKKRRISLIKNISKAIDKSYWITSHEEKNNDYVVPIDTYYE